MLFSCACACRVSTSHELWYGGGCGFCCRAGRIGRLGRVLCFNVRAKDAFLCTYPCSNFYVVVQRCSYCRCGHRAHARAQYARTQAQAHARTIDMCHTPYVPHPHVRRLAEHAPACRHAGMPGEATAHDRLLGGASPRACVGGRVGTITGDGPGEGGRAAAAAAASKASTDAPPLTRASRVIALLWPALLIIVTR